MDTIKRYWPFAFFVVLVLVIGSLGSFFTATGPWYESLRKPSFTPPGWFIGAVWTVLFVLIGLAGGFMYYTPGNKTFFWVYGLNLAVNFLWSLFFFGLHNPLLAFVDLLLIWLTIGVLIGLAWGKSRPAAFLLVPYFLWVTFAGVLNLAIVTGWLT